MRNVNFTALSGADSSAVVGTQIDANQLIAASFHSFFGDAQATGTLTVQASNDIAPAREVAAIDGFSVTHWVDISTVSVASGTSKLVTLNPTSYRWLRAKFTPTAAGVQTIQPIADTGVDQIQTIDAITDTGNSYQTIAAYVDETGAVEQDDIIFSAGGDCLQAEYVVFTNVTGHTTAAWLDIDADGTTPTGATYVSANTKIKVSILSTDTDVQVAGKWVAAVGTPIEGFFDYTVDSPTIFYQQNSCGVASVIAYAADGTLGGGSIVAEQNYTGAASNLNSTYWNFSSNDDAHKYYLWFNIQYAGVDPAPAGRIGIEIAVNDGHDIFQPYFGASAGYLVTQSATAIGLSPAGTYYTADPEDDVLILDDNFFGSPTTAAANGTASPGFAIFASAFTASNLVSTYFTVSSVNLVTKAQKDFYVWMNTDSQGVDPAVPGKTGVPVIYPIGSPAADVATAIAAALDALTNDFTSSSSTSHVTVTDKAPGLVPAAADGVAQTHFTFHNTTPGAASNLNNTYFLLQDANSAHLYYVWFNVASLGTDPLVSGRTAVPIALAAGSSASTIGTALASAIAALNSTDSFTASGTTTVTVTMKVAGPFVPMSDGTPPTHFTFTVTGGGSSTVTINFNALSM